MTTATAPIDSPLELGTHVLKSRLIVGTGKYATFDLMRDCLEASEAEVITVAIRRERLIDAEVEFRKLVKFICHKSSFQFGVIKM